VTTKSNPKPDEVITTIRLAPEVHARVKEIAEASHRTFSQQLRVAVDEHLAQFDNGHAKDAA
jgi:predicted transcriptional regulator